jgi:hypothetical protein
LLGRTTFQAPTPGEWMVSSIKLLREASAYVHGMHPWSFLGRRKEAAAGSSGPLLLTSADAARSTEDKAAVGGALVSVPASNSNASDAQQVGADAALLLLTAQNRSFSSSLYTGTTCRGLASSGPQTAAQGAQTAVARQLGVERSHFWAPRLGALVSV